MDTGANHGIFLGSRNELKSLGLTHFQYQNGDNVGMLFALASLIPIFLVVMEATIVLSRREAAGILLLAGQLTNEGFNLVLKESFQQERPNLHLGDGYGMPSSHSQFMAFFVVYTAVYLETHITTNKILKRAVQAGAIALGLLVIVSRIYLGYHTVPQVVVGGMIGVCSGCFWLWFVERAIYASKAVDIALDWPICKWLLIRDSRAVPDIVLAEYRLSRHATNRTKSK